MVISSTGIYGAILIISLKLKHTIYIQSQTHTQVDRWIVVKPLIAATYLF